jgi:hypothetical protein
VVGKPEMKGSRIFSVDGEFASPHTERSGVAFQFEAVAVRPAFLAGSSVLFPPEKMASGKGFCDSGCAGARLLEFRPEVKRVNILT